MTLSTRLEARATLCKSVGLINVPVPMELLSEIIEILKQKEAK